MEEKAVAEYPGAQLALRWLKAFRFIILDMADSLSSLIPRVKGLLKIHTILASNRLRNIANNLSEALKLVGVNPSEKPDELEHCIGEVALEALRDFKAIVNELAEKETITLRDIVSRLGEITQRIELAISGLKALKVIFESASKEEYKALSLALEAVIDDMSIIAKRHNQLIALCNANK